MFSDIAASVSRATPWTRRTRTDTIEDELREILADFGTAPDGTARTFGSAIYIQKDDVEYRVSVAEGLIVRDRVAPPKARAEQEQLLNLAVTEYEADLLRQMVALDIHDWKSGDMPTDPMDPSFARRRAEASEALLAKLNEILG